MYKTLLLRMISVGLLLLSTASLAAAADFYIDASQSNTANCGTASTPCKGYGYWYSGGCGGTGCVGTVTAGSVIHFAAGTYNERLSIPFDGTASSPVTIQCDGAAGTCVIDGTGLTIPAGGCSLIGIGKAYSSSLCNDNAATYIQLKGFAVRNIPGAMNGVIFAGSSGTHDILMRDISIDGAGASSSYLIGAVTGVRNLTFVNVSATNCPSGATGCVYGDMAANVAFVGGNFGPLKDFPTSANSDCITLQNTDTFLIDGIVAHGCTDGIDVGMLSGTVPLKNGIIRHNRVYDIRGAQTDQRLLKISGNGPGTQMFSEGISLYKNVFHHGGVAQGAGPSYMELVRYINTFYNTVFNFNAGQGSSLWFYSSSAGTGWGGQNLALHTSYNIFDSNAATVNTTISLEHDTATLVSCPESAPCPFIGNGFWFPNGASSICIRWEQSDAANAQIACNNLAAFNSGAEHEGNFRADPHFVNRSDPTVMSNLRLTAQSTEYIDRGEPFCRTTGSGSGNTIAVTCSGAQNDARRWFADPTKFYGLQNEDCRSKGSRTADGVNPGCFEIQIEGPCGVRQITSLTASSITFSGTSCSWANGAKVHLPWSGAGPDIGALEFDSGSTTTGPTAPSNLRVVP